MNAPAAENAAGSERWSHTGVILAGGRSRRMGRPKATLPLAAGGTLIEAVHGAMDGLCAQVIIAGATDTLPELARVADERENAGPLAGIEAVLASGRDGDYLFCPCDMPAIDTATLRRLLASTACVATVLHVAGEKHPRPLPARIAAWALPDVREALDAGEHAVHRALARVDAEVIAVPVDVARFLVNVNTPDEYGDLCP